MERRASLELETSERVVLSLELAGLGARAFAWLADALCVFALAILALLVYSIAGDLVGQVQALSLAGQLLALALVLAAGWGWDLAWEVLGAGRTPGKRLAGIRVVRADGGPPGLGESLVRNALRAVELPLGYAPAILAVALGPRRQRLGDLVAGTLVVRQGRHDLSRYQLPAAPDAGRLAALRRALGGRGAEVLTAEGFERVADFLRRRPELDPGPRARVAARLAAALARRAGLPGPGEAEAFLEALSFLHAEDG